MAHKITVKEVVVSFAIGDFVRIARPCTERYTSPRADEIGREGRITSVMFNGGTAQPEYGFEGGAWYAHEMFDLIHRATQKDLDIVRRMSSDEEEGDSEEGEDDDSAPDAGIEGIAQWFAELDPKLTTSVCEGTANMIRVTTKGAKSAWWRLQKATTFMNIAHGNLSGSTITIEGRQTMLKLAVVDDTEVLISVFAKDGSVLPPERMYYNLMREYDPTEL